MIQKPRKLLKKKVNKEIDDVLGEYERKLQKVTCRLMLLGVGESGKTTLLRQMRQNYGQGYTEAEFRDAAPHILRNLVEAMRTLALYSELLAEQGEATSVSKDNEIIRGRVATFPEDERFTPELCNAFQNLWNDEVIRHTYHLNHRFQLIDTAEYLFQNMHRFCEPKYLPTFDDLSHSRSRTNGINDVTFTMRHKSGRVTEQYEIYDVGGQKNERRKWITLFEHISGAIFVVPLSGYNQTLWEDQRINRMQESLALFRSIITMEGLEIVHIILFLNKCDIFEEKIKKYPLSEYFPDYNGTKGDFADGVSFIQNLFLSQNQDQSKVIYTQVSCATDPQNVNRVFNGVRDMVIRNELEKDSDHD